mgnify:CR=1 FL=1
MRLAYFSPLPPQKSGIADYSEALIEHLRRHAELDLFDGATADWNPERYDVAVYQLGNNPFHIHAYETALEHPGVVVLHEANLHHLMAERTIRRGDWDAYLREVAYDAGPDALAYARRVRALETGPDYEGVPMLRRVLERARGVIVHSKYVAGKAREAGFTGPVAVIPHGAWIAEADRNEYRLRLGVAEQMPLIGIFGFLKPYKRIPESLRALRRLVRVEPRVKMILAGEPHPGLPLDSLIRSLGLSASVRQLGFVPAEDLAGYLAACDVVLNLRYPTVGETSGTLLRALGLGRASIVSDVGAFRELPDDVCAKVPVGPGEEDLIFEYMNLLVTRPEVRDALGRRAREWVTAHCSWPETARQYAAFLEAVAAGASWPPPAAPGEPAAEPEPPPEPPAVSDGDITTWMGERPEEKIYLDRHLDRLTRTLRITPPGGPDDRILEMGAYMQITPALHTRLGYGAVRGCYFGPLGRVDRRTVRAEDGSEFACEIDLFDAEKDRFPYEDEYFRTVLCCELIEHLPNDPMHMMAEVNRILKPGGHVVLTTPNIASLRAIQAILLGYHPGFFPAYLRPAPEGGETDARHAREYTAMEMVRLLIDAGFEVTLLETGPFRDEPKPEHAWVVHLLERYRLSTELRGDGIYVVGRKTGAVRVRYPDWLYS